MYTSQLSLTTLISSDITLNSKCQMVYNHTALVFYVAILTIACFRLIFNEITGLNIDFAQMRPERRNQLYKITNLNFIFYCNLFFI